MHRGRHINDGSSAPGQLHPMFLSRLRFSGSSFIPHSYRSGFRSSSASIPQFIPAPHPWLSARGFPPWRLQLPHSHPVAHQIVAGGTLHPQNINPAHFSRSWRSLYTTPGLMMECPDRDREPPYKRRKSVEEKRSVEEREGHRCGTTGGKDGSSKKKHMDLITDRHPRSNHQFDASRDRGNNGAGKDVGRKNYKEKYVERTKTENINRQRKDSTSQDEAQNRGRSDHQQGGRRDTQTEGSRTQCPKVKLEQKTDSVHKPRPNPWFQDRREVKQHWIPQEEQFRNRSGSEGQCSEILSLPRCTPLRQNPWQVPEATRQPSPPRASSPVRRQDGAAPVKPLQRHWETSPACSTYPQPPGISTAFDFSVMCYNILSQDLLQDNVYLYGHCDPSVLPWDYRLPNLLAEIQQHNADIACLQEVQEDHYENQMKPALQALGYQCEYKKRTGDKPDGCAVIFRSCRLSLVSSNPVEFLRSGDALLDRDNVGQVVLLRPRNVAAQSDPSAFICVANTHLLYNPRRGDVKLAQLAILLAEINRLCRLPDGSTNPVVLCGDFNSTPWSPLYSFLTTGGLEYRGLQIGMVSGQEHPPRGQRFLTTPIWSRSLGISDQCQYESRLAGESPPSSPTAVEAAISNLTVEDLTTKAAAAVFNRARLEHSLKLQSSYQHRLLPDGRPEITTCHSRTAMTVDYILFTPEPITPPSLPAARGLQLLGRLSLVGQSELEEVHGLPNRHHSSDHLPLLARFRLRLRC